MPAYLLSSAVRHIGRAAFGLGLAALVGCKEKPAPPPAPVASAPAEDEEGAEQESSAKVPVAKAPESPARCREVRAGALFSIGENSPNKDSAPRGDDEEEDEPVAMPFEAELGGVVGYREGFALGVLESKKSGQAVKLGLLSADGSGRVLDVGTVHGDVQPPELVTIGEQLLVVFGDSDAGGATLQSALLAPGGDKLLAGPELTAVQREGGVALASSGKGGALVAFMRAEKKKAGLYTVRFSTGDKPAFAAPELIAGTSDAETPHLALRPGGYWLAWVDQRALPAAARARRDAGDDDDEAAGLELGPRLLRIAPLDASGRATSSPLSITKEPSHVVAFELAPWPDGGAVVAYRDDAAAPGVEGGGLHLAHVQSDGSVEQGELEDAELGAGVPSLLSDPAPRSPGAVVWLAAGGGNEATRFALLTGSGTTPTELVSDKLLGTAELVGVYGGKLLAARPRRTARDLFLLECTPAGR